MNGSLTARSRRLRSVVAAIVTGGISVCGITVAQARAAAVASGPVVSAGGTAQAGHATPDGSDTTPCAFAAVDSCQSTDPRIKTYVIFHGNNAGCTFSIDVDWGDGTATSNVQFTNPPDGTLFLAAHRYPYRNQQWIYTIAVTGAVTAGGCSFASGFLTFTQLTCTATQLSGQSWAGRYPDSTSVASLAAAFRRDVARFVSAMKKAGIAVRVLAARRLLERTYLMRYAWLIAKRQLSPTQVPAFAAGKRPPVGICWVHTDSRGADPKASVRAAGQLARALGISALRAAPPLASLRTQGMTIEMSTTWRSRKITIVDGDGHLVTIRSQPHSGLNRWLIAVGASYGVIHFIKAAQARDVWSVSGH